MVKNVSRSINLRDDICVTKHPPFCKESISKPLGFLGFFVDLKGGLGQQRSIFVKISIHDIKKTNLVGAR